MSEPDFETPINNEIGEAENRRTGTRLPFIGLRLKVRRRGGSRSAKFQECYSIDLSNSGLAFTSSSLKLTELEKVDFVLSFQNQSIQGIALVRYIHNCTDYIQYGLMFLQVLPELDTVLGAENLTTQEIKHLAGSMAEHVGYSIQEKRNEKLRITRQRQRFCDALHAYFERLSEMGVRLPAIHSASILWVSAQDAVEIDDTEGYIDFIRYTVDCDKFRPERIQLHKDQENENFSYDTGTGETFHNLFELLAYISDEISLVAKLSHLYSQDGSEDRVGQ